MDAIAPASRSPLQEDAPNKAGSEMNIYYTNTRSYCSTCTRVLVEQQEEAPTVAHRLERTDVETASRQLATSDAA